MYGAPLAAKAVVVVVNDVAAFLCCVVKAEASGKSTQLKTRDKRIRAVFMAKYIYMWYYSMVPTGVSGVVLY